MATFSLGAGFFVGVRDDQSMGPLGTGGSKRDKPLRIWWKNFSSGASGPAKAQMVCDYSYLG
jgi:hypothetical protein